MTENISEERLTDGELTAEENGAVLDGFASAADDGEETVWTDADEPVEKKSGSKLIASLIIGVLLFAVAVCGGYFFCYKKVVIPAKKYIEAVGLYEAGHYEDAIDAFNELGNYEDSAFLKSSARKQLEHATAYQAADVLFSEGKYQEARDAFAALGGFSDAAKRVTEIDEDYLSLVGRVRHAEVGDVLDLYDSKDSVIGSIRWKVLAEEDGKILLCEEYADDETAIAYDEASMAGYWALDNGSIESTSCISDDISAYVCYPGCFIPTVKFYEEYLKGNSAFTPSDGKAWVIAKDDPLPAFTDETCTVQFNLYEVSYVGADGKLEGTIPGDNLLFRYFVWVSTDESINIY